jgi:hypothetical protein
MYSEPSSSCVMPAQSSLLAFLKRFASPKLRTPLHSVTHVNPFVQDPENICF